ncbi:MAG TPA: aspartyl protease family protein [Gemmatimonadaceae bacterium]|nr:aspartyl protease family protein [Gemmatimonadaceae bacterium]
MMLRSPVRGTHVPRLARIALLLGALACRPGAVGMPEMDAAAIVEGAGAPGVPADTIDDAFTVQIDRARWIPRARPGPLPGFWDDVALLDVSAAEKAARTVDERTFVLALRTLMASDPDGAAVAFGALHSRATDPAVRARARVGLTMALSWHSDWQALARIGDDADSTEQALDPSVVQAGVERWARALADVPAAQVFVPDAPVTMPMRRSAFGTPVITVRVNGRPYEFWLDTGASMTLLSATVAVQAGVGLASPDTLALGVVAGHIPARAVLIDSLTIGLMSARGLTAAVVNPDALRLDRVQRNGLTEMVQIDGVIGTDLLRHLDLVLDAGDGTITLSRPRRDVRTPRNLFWVGYPVVKLVTREGRPVLFGLDTGAEGTFVTTSLLRKLPRTLIAAQRMTLGGLGPEKQRTRWVAREVKLSDGDYAITLRNTPVTLDRRWTFVTFDGVIGSDVALATRMHLDFANGIFDVRPSAARATLAPHGIGRRGTPAYGALPSVAARRWLADGARDRAAHGALMATATATATATAMATVTAAATATTTALQPQ